MDDQETRDRKDWDARLFLMGRPTLPPPNGIVAVTLFAAAIARAAINVHAALKHAR